MNEDLRFSSPFFTIERLTEGVYAVIEKREAETGSNAGIIDLGAHSVIFDSLLNIDASRDLKEACETLTGKKPSFLINSHYHLDHVIGNTLFAEATLISSTRTYALLQKEKDTFASTIPGKDAIERLEEQVRTELDPQKRENIINTLIFARNLSRPNVSIRLPDMTFEKEITLFGEGRTMRLISFEMGHSPGDVIAYLPEDRACFMGDILFKDSHPWLGSGEPEPLSTILRELAGWDIERFVPGHGGISSRDDVLLQADYIDELLRLVRDKMARGDMTFSPDELSPVFREWSSLCFEWNVEFLKERIRTTKVQS